MEGVGARNENSFSESWPGLQTTSYDIVSEVQELFEPIASSTFKQTTENDMSLYFKSNTFTQTPVSNLANHSKFREQEPKPDKKETNWMLRVTIPEPFRMTLRENENCKNKPCERWQRVMDKQKKPEEPEWYNKFRANAIPATTFFPLYSDMIKREESRRLARKEKCREQTLAMQKPFKFFYREEVKKLFRSKSEPNIRNNESQLKSFKAKPPPRHRRRHSNENDFKQTSVQSKHSTTTPKIKYLNERDMSLKDMRSKLQAVREWNSNASWSVNNQRQVDKRVFVPPDFNAMHADLAKKQKNQLPGKVTTSFEPFALHSNTKRLDKVKEDMKQDELNLKENRWPFISSRTMVRTPSNDGSVLKSNKSPPRLNLAAKLRVQNNTKQMLNRCEDEKQMFTWKQDLRRSLSAKMAVESGCEKAEEKLKRRKADVKSQLLGYQTELNNMMKRVANRPLLMEQQTMMAARKKAERLFADKLHQYGLTEDLLLAKSSFHPGVINHSPLLHADPSIKTLKRSCSESSTRSRNNSSVSVNRATQTKNDSPERNSSAQESFAGSSSYDIEQSLSSSKNSADDDNISQ